MSARGHFAERAWLSGEGRACPRDMSCQLPINHKGKCDASDPPVVLADDEPFLPLGPLESPAQIHAAIERVRCMPDDPETTHRFEDKIARAALTMIGDGLVEDAAGLARAVASFLGDTRGRYYS